MSYQALYRKWRPKTFDEVRGQDAIITTLKNQVASGRIGHAYLFCGTRGTGKTSVAKIFARAVNCENAGFLTDAAMPEGMTGPEAAEDSKAAAAPIQAGGALTVPCNECPVCIDIINDASMNVMEIDAASNNGVDNIRDIREQVQYPPTVGRYKVFIIDEAHMLSGGAFNALLKTLEEPPEYVIFILATTEVHKIPVTVLSRCQRYDFKRISAATISERIRELADAEGIRIDDRAIAYIAKSADGAMRDALSLLDECIAFHPGEELTYDLVLEILGAADTATFAQLFTAINQASAPAALRIIEAAVDEGKELSQFATDFLWFMRNLLVIRTAEDPAGIIDASRENIDSMKICAAAATRETLMRYIRVIAELVGRMRYSSQKRVLLELAVIRLMTPQQEPDTDALLERISRLENIVNNELRERISYIPAGQGGMAAADLTGAYGAGTDGVTGTGNGLLNRNDPDGSAGGQTAGNDPGSPTGGAAGLRTVRLHKAQYDDLMELKAAWNGLVAELTGANRVFLKDTGIETNDGDSLIIVFDRADHFNSPHRESAVKEMTGLAKKKYGKDFTFTVRLKGNADIPTAYVTEEELGKLINMDIEIES